MSIPAVARDSVLPSCGRILQITFCSGKQLRMRKIVMRSRARATGKYPSWKTGRMMQWESINELNAFRHLDCVAAVTIYAEQPCEIIYLDDDGQERYHYPDIYVLRDGSRELWEIKGAAEASTNAIQSRTNLLKRELTHYGYSYHLKTGEYLAQQPRLNNFLKLLYFGRRPITYPEREHVRQMLAAIGRLVWGDACLGTYGLYGREIACRLVLEGVLTFDLHSPISAGTRFVPTSKRS